MASYNNCYSNIVYSKLSRRLSELIMGIAMSDTNVDQRENIEQCYIMTQRIIGASLSEPHTGDSLSWFHTSRVWTVRMMKYD